MENCNGLIVDHELTPASGTGERSTAAVDMVTRLPRNHRVTVGADRGYDTADFIDDLRCRNATPHVARNAKNRRSAIDGRTIRHLGYIASQRIRRRIKEAFGWGKMSGPLRQVTGRGVATINHLCLLTYAACNPVRMRNLVGGGPRRDSRAVVGPESAQRVLRGATRPESGLRETYFGLQIGEMRIFIKQ